MYMRTKLSDSQVSVAYNRAKASQVRMPCVILVSPFVDANVGSVSRAMLNFGLHDLRVVSPDCDIFSPIAQQLAVGSVEVLRNARVFSSLQEAISDLQLVVATTSRSQSSLNQPFCTAEEAAALMVPAPSTGCAGNAGSTETAGGDIGPIAAGIVFGRERNGLRVEELALADVRVVIPAFEGYPVLNLAQAVNIAAYECYKRKTALLAQYAYHKEALYGGDDYLAADEAKYGLDNITDSGAAGGLVGERWKSGSSCGSSAHASGASQNKKIDNARPCSKGEFEVFFSRWSSLVQAQGRTDAIQRGLELGGASGVDPSSGEAHRKATDDAEQETDGSLMETIASGTATGTSTKGASAQELQSMRILLQRVGVISLSSVLYR